MKNKRNLHLATSIVCFIFAAVCATVYGFWRNDTVRFVAAAGFAACSVIFIKMFLEYLKDIRFANKLLGPLKKFFGKLCKTVASKFGIGDDDKIYLESKKDEFKIKFEMFKSAPKQTGKKPPARLPKYGSLKTEKEKIRHIYTVFLKKRSERGYNVNPALTSDEISADFAGNEKARLLFETYPAARYGAEDEPIDAENVKKLEELM
jgi:hypothetical protein